MSTRKIAAAVALICTLGAADAIPHAVRFDPISLSRSLPDLASVSTIAGSGRSGTADGPPASATFIEPMGLAADRSGTLYVCDRFGQRVRRVAPDGTVTTIAGGGAQYAPSLAVPPGYVDGPGPIARFNRPTGVAVSSEGTLYVTDEGNHVVRAIRDGVVSTYAGHQATPGHVDGARTSATFAAPSAIALDAFGNLYVADYPVLRRISPTGGVTTIATSGPVVSLTTTIDDGNRHVVAGLRDTIVLIDGSNGAILRQRFTREVESQEVAGEVGGIAAYDAHSLVYVDTLAQIVRFRTFLEKDDYTRPVAGTALQRNYSRGGGFRDGPGDAALFSLPTGIAILPGGAIAISDTGNRRIRRLTPFNVESAGKNEQLGTELPPAAPKPDEFRIVLVGDSYVWTNVGWHESIGGILADALERRTRNCTRHATVYVVRRPGLLPTPGFEYIDEVLATGIASMVIFDVPEGGESGAQLSALVMKSRRALEEANEKLVIVTFPESWDIASESEFFRESHRDLDILGRAYEWPRRKESIDALGASGTDVIDVWPAVTDAAASANHQNVFESGDIHLTPYGNALIAGHILDRLDRESPWGTCTR